MDSLALAVLVGALQRDAPHGFADLFPGLPLVPEPLCDFLALAPAPEFQLGLEELGEAEVCGPPLGEVLDCAQLIVVGGVGSVGGVGHVVRVRAWRRLLKTHLEDALDSSRRDLYGRTNRPSRRNLEGGFVVHSYRTQSADGTQMKTGRTLRLLPRRPALTTRF